MTHALAVAAIEKIERGGRHAATLQSVDETMAIFELVLAMAEKIRELEQRLGEKTDGE